MGEDIHQRIYLKRRDGKYVNAHEVCSWNPEYTLFDELVGGRNYDLFSLFGSGRGNYEILPSAKYGMPEFLKNTDFDEYCKAAGFYGFVWFTISELARDIEDFIARLSDPIRYLEKDSEAYADWKELLGPGKKTAKQMETLRKMYAEWFDEHGPMLMRVNELCCNIKHFTSAYCPAQQASSPYSIYCKMFDMEQTVFLFFFDC